MVPGPQEHEPLQPPGSPLWQQQRSSGGARDSCGGGGVYNTAQVCAWVGEHAHESEKRCVCPFNLFKIRSS